MKKLIFLLILTALLLCSCSKTDDTSAIPSASPEVSASPPASPQSAPDADPGPEITPEASPAPSLPGEDLFDQVGRESEYELSVSGSNTVPARLCAAKLGSVLVSFYADTENFSCTLEDGVLFLSSLAGENAGIKIFYTAGTSAAQLRPDIMDDFDFTDISFSSEPVGLSLTASTVFASNSSETAEAYLFDIGGGVITVFAQYDTGSELSEHISAMLSQLDIKS